MIHEHTSEDLMLPLIDQNERITHPGWGRLGILRNLLISLWTAQIFPCIICDCATEGMAESVDRGYVIR